MTKPTLSLENAISPFSSVTGLTWPTVSGFIVTPGETASSPGWGFPIYPGDDSTKPRIFPGTLGGEHQRTVLREVKGAWKEHKTKELQSAGSIDWWGYAPDSLPGTKRAIISYNGPKSRHFPDGFQYGASSRDSHIYMNGGLVGIAPGPVTGACLRRVNIADIEYVNYKHRLVVVCLEGGKETMYIRLLPSVVFESRLTAEAEKLLSRKRTDKLEGWDKLGEVGSAGYDTPTSPWFFNKSGTEAQCIRVKDHTYSPTGGSGESVTQKVGHRFKMTVSDTFASTQNLGNDAPFVYTETGSKTLLGNWTPALLDEDGYSHTWEEIEVKSHNTLTGTQVVAVDYVDDAEVIVRMTIDSTLGFIKDYMKGMDTYVDTPELSILKNTGQYQNRLVATGRLVDDFASPTVRTNGDHRGMLWTFTDARTTLDYSVGGQAYMIAVEAQHNTRNNETENILTHAYNDRAYVRYLDVRSEVVFVTLDRTDWDVASANVYPKAAEATATDLTPTEGTFYNYFADSGPIQAVPIVSSFRAPLRVWVQADYVEARALPDGEWTWQYSTYTGKKPTSNDDNSKGKYNSFWHIRTEDYQTQEGYLGMGMIRHSRYTQECGVAITPEGSLVASLNVPDPADAAKTKKLYVVHSTDIDPATLAGGKRLYPLGII